MHAKTIHDVFTKAITTPIIALFCFWIRSIIFLSQTASLLKTLTDLLEVLYLNKEITSC
jgi:hypothetical protein